MKKRSSVRIAICLLLAIMLVVTGCGSKSGGDKVNSTNTPTNGSKDAEGKDPAEKPLDKVTFTYFNGAGAAKDINTNETTIGKILEDQTGVNFKIENLVGDLNTKIGTMNASRKYPDVLIPDAAIDEVLAAGGFIDLTKLIDEYGPNIKRVYGPYMEQMKDKDGKIMFLPFSNVVGEFVPDPNINQGAFWVQRGVLKEAGYPEIKTIDQYFQLIRDYEKKHEGDNLTGFISLTHDWRFFATTNAPMHLAGYPNDGEVTVDMSTFEAKVYSNNDDTKRYMKLLNELNAEGLFDKASFIDNYDQYLAKLTSGKVLGFFDYGWQIANAQNVLKDAAKADPTQDDLVYFPLPITFDGQKDQYLDPPGFVKNRGMGITVSAQNPERIIQFIDNLLTEENQIMKSWGIQGETYEINEEGRFYRTAEQVKKIDEPFRESFGFKYFDWNWPQYGTNSTLENGNAYAPGYQPEVFQMDMTEADKTILAAYGVQTYAEMFAAPDDRPWYPAWGIAKEQGSAEQIYETKKTELTRKYFPKLVLDPPSKFDSNWEEFTAEFNKLDTAGYETFVTSEIKKIIDGAK
ncbi:MAG: ABC transporter substrate-binding protein [Candidatus Pristimantibacillus lignocellulolyticus]|uniref:ABC transporter substrate-binding protein n=1 Tax=Candidatus Pristimantibacillus lignocellulolyticus TaxID=2994561 RepID=A0A9J6ZGM3_9BACL|nr:MAG: ABC transporter substrate-binding protein [Candidatus Pristimantibacillus lignocellulolyticus]